MTLQLTGIRLQNHKEEHKDQHPPHFIVQTNKDYNLLSASSSLAFADAILHFILHTTAHT